MTRHPSAPAWHLLSQLEPWLDAAFPIATTLLCLNQGLAAYSLLALYLLLRLVNHTDQMPWRWILIGLLIINAGVIIQDRDFKPSGATDYLIIALSFTAGIGNSHEQWKRSLTWIASCIIPLLAFSLKAGQELISLNTSFIGFNINKLGFLAGFLAIISYGTLKQADTKRKHLFASILICASAAEVLLSQSRSALAVPAIAIATDQLSRIRWTLRRSLLTAFACLTITGVAAHSWYGSFAIQGNTLSDLNRLETIRCWLTSTGSSKQGLLLGFGFGKTAQNFCGPEQIPSLKTMEKTRGLRHAHNFYAQIFAETGIAGLAMAIALTALAFRRAWQWKVSGLRPVCFPMVIYLFLMSLGITYWQVLMLNQVLVGYGLAALIAAAPDPAIADASTPAEPPDVVASQA